MREIATMLQRLHVCELESAKKRKVISIRNLI